MSNIADIQPDAALQAALDKKIIVHTDADNTETLTVYAHSERPNKGLADEFIDITINGVITSVLHPLGMFKGGLAVIVYCKTSSSGAVRKQRIADIVGQLEKYLTNRKYGRYFFSINHSDVITPTTINVTTGYSATVLNVGWYRTEERPETD